MQAIIEYGEWVCIKKCRTVPIDGRVFVIELDVAGTKIWVVGILMEAEHEVSFRFDPGDAVVFVVDTGWVPESNLQSCILNVVRGTHERCRLDIREYVPRPSSRWAIAHILAASLVRQSVVNISEEGALCIPVATSKKNHDVSRKLARGAVCRVSHVLASGFNIRVEFQRVFDESAVFLVLLPERDHVAAFTEIST